MTDSVQVATDAVNVRPCLWYLDEYNLCRNVFARIHQHFLFGKGVDCEDWNRDYRACIALRASRDLHEIEDNLKTIIKSEAQRKQQQLNARRKNNVWNYRRQPPKNWNEPPPAWFIEANKGSYLEQYQIKRVNELDKHKREHK